MTEQEQQRKIKHRLAVLRHYEEVTGNVSATCRYCAVADVANASRGTAQAEPNDRPSSAPVRARTGDLYPSTGPAEALSSSRRAFRELFELP
jgi:hypothetical protein